MKREIEEIREQSKKYYQELLKCPIYYHMMKIILANEKYLEMCCWSPPGNPAVFSLKAAIHYLLLQSYEEESLYPPHGEELVKFYPALARKEEFIELNENTIEKFEKTLTSFLDDSNTQEKLISLIKNNSIQTNEARRCATLLPAYIYVMNEIEKRGQKGDFVEFGCSAGLLTFWDLYTVSFNFTDEISGEKKKAILYPREHPENANNIMLETEIIGPLLRSSKISDLLIQSANEGKGVPFSTLIHSIDHRRVALDLRIINLDDNHENRWFRSLIWPHAYETRIKSFNVAFNILSQNKEKCNWIQGDALNNLVEVLSPSDNNNNNNNDKDKVTVLVHSYCLYQLSEEQKEKVENCCLIASMKRDIYRICLDNEETIGPQVKGEGSHLHVFIYRNGERVETTLLATGPAHGEWLKFHHPSL